MMEAARFSETSVNIQLRTRQYIPEDSELNGIISAETLGSASSVSIPFSVLRKEKGTHMTPFNFIMLHV
jgi:hypothetical protein